MHTFLDKNGLLYVIQHFQRILLNKVDSVVGKGLSTNDYTTADKDKLQFVYDFANNYLDKIYPIGSIYITYDTKSPQILFGGEWEKIKDRFLLSSGDSYINGDIGGEATHILTIAEMPEHNHQLKTDIDNEAWNVTWPEWFEYTDGWTQQAGETQAPATHTTKTGGGIPHNNMPPYLVVNIWKRIG